MTSLEIKQRFGVIGTSPLLDRAIDIAAQVAPTDLSVLVTGESGSGKEVFSKIIHNLSSRKHGTYIAVNCGAIPEGTIDSELFGHEKGSFTGAHEARKGYFEVADKGTIFLDEVAELPLSTQVRLLRVLETGEFIRVGASKSIKTSVRVVAATNVNMPEAVAKGKFREDLFYRLNTVPIAVPSLKQRRDDIPLLFRKFAADFAEKYRMPAIRLDEAATEMLKSYNWPGNVRQLKNVTEQVSIIEKNRNISTDVLVNYLPAEHSTSNLPIPMAVSGLAAGLGNQDFTERELLYKVLFDMKKDIVDLKKLVFDIISSGGQAGSGEVQQNNANIIRKLYEEVVTDNQGEHTISIHKKPDIPVINIQDHEEIEEESLSLEDREKELIIKALEKHKGKRKKAAEELGISERTLYRKISEYNLDL
ncbi:MAG: sigma-54 dependent transcriptional regulator [Bacteroidia bacterium]|nr:sigma-54 dependent transcriptional regulator [Bacteroidia bacterium]